MIDVWNAVRGEAGAVTGGAAPAIALEALRFAWQGRGSFALEVDGFELARGSRMILAGPSGSGKSTLLSLICGIVVPQAGRVTLIGQDITQLGGAARDLFRAEHCGIVFQGFNLVPYLSVRDNIRLPLSFAPGRRQRVIAGGGMAGEVARLMQRLALEPELAGQPAARLSVGQQQRVAVARALIGSPEIIVADEPTSSLDRDRQLRFLDLLFEEVARVGATLLMVSHDRDLGSRFDNVIELGDIARVANQAAAG